MPTSQLSSGSAQNSLHFSCPNGHSLRHLALLVGYWIGQWRAQEAPARHVDLDHSTMSEPCLVTMALRAVDKRMALAGKVHLAVGSADVR